MRAKKSQTLVKFVCGEASNNTATREIPLMRCAHTRKELNTALVWPVVATRDQRQVAERREQEREGDRGVRTAPELGAVCVVFV
jgi:hypothetical protein